MLPFKRVISFLTAMVLLLSMMPHMALDVDAVSKIRTIDIRWRPNPLYPDTPAPDFENRGRLATPTELNPDDYLDLDAAAEYTRSQLVARSETIAVNLKLDYSDPRSSNGDSLNVLLNEAFSHTGVPDEGDYQYLTFGGCGADGFYFEEDNCGYFSFVIYASYYTTAEQEQEMDLAVEQVMKELALDDLTDYEKVVRIYDYITENVRYDFTNLENPDYLLKFSAYAALLNGTAVCQGYATLLYRLLLETGVDGRCIMGYANGPHAWNIVKLGDLYYHADSTWDEGIAPQYYNYFLKGERFYLDHIPYDTYQTPEFLAEYPLSSEDFDPDSAHAHSYTHQVVVPTCTEEGYTVYICACGYSYTDSVTAALGHAWDNGVIIKEPTEDEEGEKTFTCTVCGEKKTESIPKLDHVHNYETVITTPSCTEGGYTTYTCRCGHSYVSDETAPAGHKWNDGVVTKEPTEDAEGEMTFTCTVCGEKKTESIPKLDHVHNYETVITTPSCTEGGYTTYTCRCGHSYVSDETAPAGHKWNDGVVTKEPTEDTEGEMTFTCTVCGVTKTESIPKLDHVHNYEGVITAPTCTEGGYTTYTCRCGHSYVADKTAPAGHKWNDGAVTKEPTEDAEGEMTFTCTVCGVTKTEPIPKLDHVHNYETVITAPTCTDGGYTTYTCRCGHSYVSDETAPAGHKWNDGAVTKEPTEDAEGEMTFTCTVCGETETEPLPRLDHIHNYETFITAPTCTEGGYTTYLCSCGDSYMDDLTEPTGHVYAKAFHLPTCTEEGFTYYFCHCGDSYMDDYLPATGHSYESAVVEPSCGAEGYTLHACSACGDSYKTDFVPALDHSYVETVIPGTCQERVSIEYTCEYCGHSYRQTTGEWGDHVWGDGVVEEEPTMTSPGKMVWCCTLCSAWRWEELPPVEIPFVDVEEGQYYLEPVIWAVEQGITAGTDATHFSPNRNCTRGQVVTFLWRAAGCPEPETVNNPFSDVAQGQYYYKPILWAVENGITAGVGGGRFAPDQEVTRAQFVTFLWRWAGKVTLPVTEEPFTDVQDGDYFRDAVVWALEQGITQGTSATTFGSNLGCTRGQVVTFLYRYDRTGGSGGSWFDPPEGVEVFRHELWESATKTDPADLPGYTSHPTAENLELVLEACNPDGALFLRWDQEEFLQWIYPDGTITSDTNTAIHETYHAFSSPYNGRDQRYYLGDGWCVDVDTTYSFYTSEINQWIPQEHHTFRYDLYVLGSEHANMWSIIGGMYGLMNEFNAYGTGMMFNVSMFDYYCAQGMTYEAWKDYINGCENDRMAYAEFRYWMLTYLLYAQENYPAVYEDLMENMDLRYAFTAVEGRYAENIALYEEQLSCLAEGEIPGMESIRVEEDVIWFGVYGIGRFNEDYDMLMTYMERPEYQEILETFRTN